MGQRWIRFNLSIALGLSLSAHGGLLVWMVHEHIGDLAAALRAGRAKPVIELTESSTPATTSDDAIGIDMELGDWNGTGTAIAPAEGEMPLAGLRGTQDQPLLSRDPVGHGRVGDAPTQYTGPIGRGSEALAQLRASLALPDAGEASAALRFPNESPLVSPPRPPRVAGVGQAPASRPAAGPTVIASAGGASEPAEPSGDAPRQSADPAPLSDSEIDLFSKAPIVEFRPGKAAPQFGRKATLTRPHIPLAGQIDAFALGRKVQVGLILNTDETGKVINARVARSAGSNDIDNPVRREAYNWSFDPGEPEHPLPREFPLVVAIYH